jgi:CysZ protein
MHNFIKGFSYLFRGLKLLQAPQLRLFVIIPLTINIIAFAVFGFFAFEQLNVLMATLVEWLPDWLDFLSWLVWPLAILLLLVIGFYSFSMIANLFAAPFNGLLAEHVEILLRGGNTNNTGITDTLKDAPRIMGKELRKIFYYLPRTLLLLPVSFIPVIGPIIWFAFGAWMAAVAYIDYPLDNHKYSLADVMNLLRKERALALGFGTATLLGTMIPLVNFFVMPAAVCGATALFVDTKLSKNYISQQ